MTSILFANGTQSVLAADTWHQVIVTRGYRAAIFDCDGTLVDSCDAHFHALQYAVQSQGMGMARDWYFARTGLDRISILQAFAAEIEGPFDVTRAAQDSIAAFVLRSKAVRPIPETTDLIKALGPAFPMAVGTNAERSVARASLQAAGFVDRFAHIVSVSDGLPAKPAPDIFQVAAEKLGAPSAQTLVFEDSNEGVSAALAAGLDVIQLIDDHQSAATGQGVQPQSLFYS